MTGHLATTALPTHLLPATGSITVEQFRRRQAARLRVARGALAERAVEMRLRALGYLLVERVIVPTARTRKGKVRYLSQVSGDFRALAPGGRSVLVESKCREAGRLFCSDLAPHQRRLLTTHADAGGISLLAWFRPELVLLAVVEWHAVRQAFAPGSSLAWDEATALSSEQLRAPDPAVATST